MLIYDEKSRAADNIVTCMAQAKETVKGFESPETAPTEREPGPRVHRRRSAEQWRSENDVNSPGVRYESRSG